MWRALATGTKRRWRSGLAAFLQVLGAVWLLSEVALKTEPSFDTWLTGHRNLYLIVAVALSAVGYLFATYEPRSVSFTIPTTNTELTFKFANLFDEKADWLIGANEFFDSRIGDLVSKRSLHGQLICDHYGGDEQRFRRDVDNSLAGEPSELVERQSGEQRRFAIGTTAVLDRGENRTFLVALSRTDLRTNKANSSIPELWSCLVGSLRVVHERGNGRPLCLPLMGNGSSNINLPPQHLLRLLTLAIVESARSFQLPQSVTVALSEDCFSALDLREIRRDWRAF